MHCKRNSLHAMCFGMSEEQKEVPNVHQSLAAEVVIAKLIDQSTESLLPLNVLTKQPPIKP